MHMFYRVMKGIHSLLQIYSATFQILLKLVNIWLSYCEKQKGEVFLKHGVVYTVQGC